MRGDAKRSTWDLRLLMRSTMRPCLRLKRDWCVNRSLARDYVLPARSHPVPLSLSDGASRGPHTRQWNPRVWWHAAGPRWLGTSRPAVLECRASSKGADDLHFGWLSNAGKVQVETWFEVDPWLHRARGSGSSRTWEVQIQRITRALPCGPAHPCPRLDVLTSHCSKDGSAGGFTSARLRNRP